MAKTVKRTTKRTTTKNSPRNTKNSSKSLSNDERYRMICEAAYFRAEGRGFCGGNPVEDWLCAEKEINQKYC